MHYPIHFHMARTVPLNTYVNDSSMWDSMNRWVTIHGTQGVTLQRNVGYLSIGHGFYLEDGTETGNVLIANLGVMARGSINNEQNPRKVPGILSHGHHPELKNDDETPYNTDADHPTVFWISNGWNSFGYNVAAGANSCGVCYWFLPAANSGMSRFEHWDYYSAEQEYRTKDDANGTHDDFKFAGTTPLFSFVGNSCVAAQSSFLSVGDTAACKVVTNAPAGDPAYAIPSPYAPEYPRKNEDLKKFPASDAYYPKMDPDGSRAATVCSVSDTGSPCKTGNMDQVNTCSYNAQSGKAEGSCTVTRLDRYTTSFNWADTNVSAVWLRKQWYLFVNGAVTDVQNGGLTFVSGGGYTYSDEIPGYWALAHKSVFVGNTQKILDAKFPLDAFASNAGPFNPKTWDLGLHCQANVNGVSGVCASTNDGIFFGTTDFAMNQRLFNIYDGPNYEQSNAFLDISRTVLTDCLPGQGNDVCRDTHHWGNGGTQGVPQDSTAAAGAQCYLPNAAIAWKQPNAFYYPPAFRSSNLFFDRVDTRHFVIEPLFSPNTLDSNQEVLAERYCTYPGLIKNHYGEMVSTMFQPYTDIDRQTELTDEDGSLTGLQGPTINKFRMPAISVNKDLFFRVPIETAECSSDIFNNIPTGDPLNGHCAFKNTEHDPNVQYELCGTANTSPYDYLTTVVFPQEITGQACPGGDDGAWSLHCADQHCPGVSLYRLDLLKDELDAPLIRMAGQHTGQRSTLTTNHGRYYLDTSVSDKLQDHFACKNFQDDPDHGVVCTEHACKNVFEKDKEYYVFFLYGRPGEDNGPPPTKQDYSLYVGQGFKVADDTVFGIRVDQGQNPPKVISRSTMPWKVDGPDANGVITVHVDMSATALKNFLREYATEKQKRCAPAAAFPAIDPLDRKLKDRNYCAWNGSSCGCAIKSNDPECDNACSNWAGKDINCPDGGCYGFGFKLPDSFVADDTGTQYAKGTCLTADSADWNTPFVTDFNNPNTFECKYQGANIPNSFCTSVRHGIGFNGIGGNSH